MSLYLFKRGSIYYFRRAVPLELQAEIGIREIVVSLHTKDLQAAKLKRTVAIESTDRLLDAAHQKLGNQISSQAPPKPEAPFELAAPSTRSFSVLPREKHEDFRTWERVLEIWERERKVVPKTRDAYRSAAKRFFTIVKKSPARIAKADVIAFKDDLFKTGASPANVKGILSKIHALMAVAVGNGIASLNPVTGIKIVVIRQKRLPFSYDDLLNIFSRPIFTANERPEAGRGEAAFWLPILGLFHGSREEELGQLRVKDVRAETFYDDKGNKCSWPFIHIVEDKNDGLKLKNKGSERYVPVHPFAISLGFIDYVQALRAKGTYWVFPDLRPGSYGRRTAKWGEWFGKFLRLECAIGDKRKVFHSLRHTFKDLTRHCGVSPELQRQIMGHAGVDVADEYGSGYSFFQLVEAIKLVRVPGLAIKGLTY